MSTQAQNTPMQPERQRYVEQEMNRLAATLGGIEASADELISRINGVLRAEPPQPGQKIKEVNQALCPLADALSNMASKADEILDRLNNVRSRLEL